MSKITLSLARVCGLPDGTEVRHPQSHVKLSVHNDWLYTSDGHRWVGRYMPHHASDLTGWTIAYAPGFQFTESMQDLLEEFLRDGGVVQSCGGAWRYFDGVKIKARFYDGQIVDAPIFLSYPYTIVALPGKRKPWEDQCSDCGKVGTLQPHPCRMVETGEWRDYPLCDTCRGVEAAAQWPGPLSYTKGTAAWARQLFQAGERVNASHKGEITPREVVLVDGVIGWTDGSGPLGQPEAHYVYSQIEDTNPVPEHINPSVHMYCRHDAPCRGKDTPTQFDAERAKVLLREVPPKRVQAKRKPTDEPRASCAGNYVVWSEVALTLSGDMGWPQANKILEDPDEWDYSQIEPAPDTPTAEDIVEQTNERLRAMGQPELVRVPEAPDVVERLHQKFKGDPLYELENVRNSVDALRFALEGRPTDDELRALLEDLSKYVWSHRGGANGGDPAPHPGGYRDRIDAMLARLGEGGAP